MSRNDRKIVWRGQFLTTLTRTSEVWGPVEQVKAEMQRPMNTTAKPRESEQLPLFNTF